MTLIYFSIDEEESIVFLVWIYQKFFLGHRETFPWRLDVQADDFYLYAPIDAQTASTVEMRRVSEQGLRRTAEKTVKVSVKLCMGVALRSTMGIPE